MKATTMSQRLWVLLALLLCLNAVLAGVVRPLPRQKDVTTTEATSASSTPSASTTSGHDVPTSTHISITSSTGSSTGSATSTIISATPIAPNNSTQFNTTVPGQLPLTPTRTPGFYVAGLILMISGAVYLAFGMKRQWIHCYFSFALLVAIAITALELLLVPSPISNGAQAGYIVGVIVGGAVAGGLAILRPKFFHFFGSVLGGFCLAMWLLTLKESALLGQSSLKNCVFLAVFSLTSLGFYCYARVRHYVVMFASCFAGATAFILGVDCLSCAGLKEFWAWIWNLPNDKLFPIDADTYPLTTGIKAELGVTFVVFFIGGMFQWSQLNNIKEQRIKKEIEREAGRAAVRRKDEKAGLEFERKIATERRDFEATYRGPQETVYEGRGSRMDSFLSSVKKAWMSTDGKRTTREEEPGQEQAIPREVDERAENFPRQTSAWTAVGSNPKHQICASVHTANDSGMGDADTERKHVSGSATSVTRVSTAAEEKDIELDEIRPVASPQPKSVTAPVMGKEGKDGRVTVHVAAEEVKGTAATWTNPNPVPDVIPLPFKVPSIHEDQTHADDEDCSSVAVMTEGFHHDELHETRSIGSKRSSFAKRLSTGSAEILRRLSHHSLSNHLDKAVIGEGESTEDLAAASQHVDRTSIAATWDDVSSVDEDGLPDSKSLAGRRPFSKEIKAELADIPTNETKEEVEKAEEAGAKNSPGPRPASLANVAVGTLEIGAEGIEAQESACTQDSPKEEKGKQVAKEISDNEAPSKAAKTNTSDAPSQSLTLATGQLEKRVSEIVKKYRINEWTKHQTLAEEPILDNLDFSEAGDPSVPVPVNVEELLLTAEAGAPRVAKPRTEALLQARARKASAQSQSQSRLSPSPENDHTSSMGSDERKAAIQATTAALMGGAAQRASPTVPAADVLRSRPPIPGVKSFNTPQSLVAKRETMLRMKQEALRPDSLRSSPLTSPGIGSPLVYNQAQGHGSVAALGLPNFTSAPNSAPNSRRNSGTYRSVNMSSALQNDQDDDDMPLSQRQAIIRERRSSMNLGNSSGGQAGSTVGSSRCSFSGHPGEGYGGSASALAVNHNLPHIQRRSFSATQNRQSQLAGFRSSVQADLKASNTSLPVTSMLQQPGFGGGYISNSMTPVPGPLINSVYSIPGASSANSLLPQQTQGWNAEVSMNLEVQRQYMMAKKDNDARRRESRRAERERKSQIRQSNMGTPRMLDAHSAALMNLQKKARDAL